MDSSFWPWRKTNEHAMPAHFISSPEKIKIMPSAGKILLTVFWDSQRVYVTIFGSWEYCQISSVHWNNKKPTAEGVWSYGVNIADFVASWQSKTAHCSRNDWSSGDAEVWGSLPSTLQPWLGTKRFPFLSSPQEVSHGDSFHLRRWMEASCGVVDQTKNSWMLHWRHV